VVDGILFSGGRDLPPSFYREAEIHDKTETLAPERATAEIALAAAAIESGLPVLGICMGCQLINVALGGSLFQDIPSEIGTAINHGRDDAGDKPVHTVRLEAGSRLHAIAGLGEMPVNSTHHQAVKALGRGLTAVARADDGVVEAVELPGRWVLGVQWHPERLRDTGKHMALFRALTAAALSRGPA
jgi:putative glutamine amidotransferase